MLCALLLLVALLFSPAFSQHVVELTKTDFDSKVNDFQCALVMFYAPWCGHCKAFKPAFEEAANRLAVELPDVTFARIDCTTNDESCAKFQVSGYPTIKLFKSGKFVRDYDASRTADGAVNFMREKCKAPSKLLVSKVEFENLMAAPATRVQPVILAYCKKSDDPLLLTFLNVASKLGDGLNFAHTHDSELIQSDGSHSIRLFRPPLLQTNMEEKFLDYKGDFSEDDIRKWISLNAFGLVGYRNHVNKEHFPKEDLLVLYNNASVDTYIPGVKYYRNRLLKALKENEQVLSGLKAAYSFSGDFMDELDRLQYKSTDDLPMVAIYSGGKTYLLEAYKDPASITKFVKQFKDGALKPYVKSEPIPEDNTGVVKKVVGHTFDSIVKDPTKDVMVVFHAPWCGHCKALMPKYEELAEKLKNEPNLSFTTYDATANDVPSAYKVTGYPTVYFVAKSDKENPKSYEGKREVDDMIKFVAASSSDELRGYDRKGKAKKVEL